MRHTFMHVEVPLVTREEEEEAMRPATPGERPCINGVECEGALMHGGYTLPRFRGWTQCVVCLRVWTLDRWLALPETVVQPYRVHVGEGGYSTRACLQPCFGSFDGVPDPYVRHSPWRYQWRGLKLEQLHVDYELVPSLRHEAREPAQTLFANGLPDVFDEVARCGIVHAPARVLKGVARALQRALFERAVAGLLDSSYAQALLGRGMPKPHCDALAALACAEHAVITVQSVPVLEKHVRARHAAWTEYAAKIHAACLAVRSGGAVPPRAKHPLLVQVAPEAPRPAHEVALPAHWLRPPRADRLVQCYCPACSELKCEIYVTLFAGEKKRRYSERGQLAVYGQRHVSYSLDTGAIACFRSKTAGRLAKAQTCAAPLAELQAAGHMLEIQCECYAQCTSCGVVCRREAVLNVFECAACVAARAAPMCCMVCRDTKKLERLQVFSDAGVRGTATVALCKKHQLDDKDPPAVWNRWLLERRLRLAAEAEASKRYATAVRRG